MSCRLLIELPVSGPAATHELSTSRSAAAPFEADRIGATVVTSDGRAFGIRFEANGTVMLILGLQSDGRNYASPLFAFHLAGRLGVPLRRIRLYYAGMHPVVRRNARPLTSGLLSLESNVIFVETREILDVLCGRVVEQARLAVARFLSLLPADVAFHARCDRFYVAGIEVGFGMMDLAAWVRKHPRARLGPLT
jgi:hypothetical protein